MPRTAVKRLHLRADGSIDPCAGPSAPDQRVTYTSLSPARMQFPHGDHLCNCWLDGYVYLCSCDNLEVNSNVSVWKLGPGYSPNGNTPIPATLVNAMPQFGALNVSHPSDNSTFKLWGMVTVGGKLYIAIGRMVFGSWYTHSIQIIVSEDHGNTWSPQPPAVATPFDSPQFPDKLNNCLTFFIYGENNTQTAHRGDEFVYGFSFDGPDMRLGRCPIDRMSDIHTAQYWQYYHGGNGMLDENWSSDWDGAYTVIHLPLYDGGGNGGAADQPKYFPNYKGGRYVWFANWHPWPAYGSEPAHPEYDPGIEQYSNGRFDYVESPTPWGPWEYVDTYKLNTIAATVVSGNIAGLGRGGSFPNFLSNSVRDTSDSAISTLIHIGSFATADLGIGDPDNQYMLHLSTFEMQAGTSIPFAPWPPAITPIPPTAAAQAVTGAVSLQFSYRVQVNTFGHNTFVSSSLPPGLQINSSSGLISGKPTIAGTTNATISITNDAGTIPVSLEITILPEGSPFVVQQAYDFFVGPQTSISAKFAKPVASGHTVVVVFSVFEPIYPTSVTDNAGNSYTIVLNEDFASGYGGSSAFTMAVGLNIQNGPTTITATYGSAGQFMPLTIIEFAGDVRSIVTHDSTGRHDSTDTWSVGPVSISNTSLIVAWGQNPKGGPITIGSPFTQFTGVDSYGGYYVTSSGSVTANFTVTGYDSGAIGRPGAVAGLIVLRIGA